MKARLGWASFGGVWLRRPSIEGTFCRASHLPKTTVVILNTCKVAYRMVFITLLGSYRAFSLGEVECLGWEFGLRRQDQVVRGGGIILPRIFVHHCELKDF